MIVEEILVGQTDAFAQRLSSPWGPSSPAARGAADGVTGEGAPGEGGSGCAPILDSNETNWNWRIQLNWSSWTLGVAPLGGNVERRRASPLSANSDCPPAA